ncbi:hypothetical protein BAUCODRAFT_255142 [Baudoinia panamericana UAMH 10762]|uniref:Uncharacterized protein n=1 Tax=Baudoinia panamericana (strain UAMH 10762) TaxID=717646 RepID=M2N1S7_BAUPA|nr:uncharacterized protein BAUCODRAFT_255142 [Baudoinia panamericana UAMH 10762]EMC92600.1 hypothetical protein BAUCODRAFT_255142 [Baudoinia panamericana UAMH 10762]
MRFSVPTQASIPISTKAPATNFPQARSLQARTTPDTMPNQPFVAARIATAVPTTVYLPTWYDPSHVTTGSDLITEPNVTSARNSTSTSALQVRADSQGADASTIIQSVSNRFDITLNVVKVVMYIC